MRNALLTTLLPYLEPHAPLPDGKVLAAILKDLASCEIEEGGPYASEPGGNETDLGLNLAIALFLRVQGVSLPKLDAYITQSLRQTAPSSSFFDRAGLMDLMLRYREAGSSTQAGVTDDRAHWTGEELDMLRRIRAALDARLVGMPEVFADAVRELVERTILKNPDKQMSLMPLFMRQALGKRGRRLGDDLLAEVGLASVLFWTAFIVYDDFWDEDEAAVPAHLPLANFCARFVTEYFGTAAPTAFPAFFRRYMDKLDAANHAEVSTCRLERKGNSFTIPETLPKALDPDARFYPASGHAMGPLLLLSQLGYGEYSQEAQECLAYFTQYLIAMQLNDDAHDWKEDLDRGRVSYAVGVLLEAWRIEHPQATTLELARDLAELERLFWFTALPKICEAIQERTTKAQESLNALVASGLILNPAPLQVFIDRNAAAATQARTEQARSVEFLAAID